MAKFFRFTFVAIISSLMISSGMLGCTKKPNTEDVSKLEEAKAAAESAERKLSELRVERMQLEKELDGAKSEEQGENQELKDVQDGEK
jgi:hypothetical protein